jgi:hypothetical protein
MTFQQRFEQLAKIFAEKNDENENAFEELITKKISTIYNPATQYIKTEIEIARAGKNFYRFLLYARNIKASPEDNCNLSL